MSEKCRRFEPDCFPPSPGICFALVFSATLKYRNERFARAEMMESVFDMIEFANISDRSAAFEPDVRVSQPWYCLRTHPKHEHIAAAQLREQEDVEVFLPRIRYRRTTRLGPVWVTEALFRDYLFARFELAVALRRVQHGRGVCGVVHFGDHWPTVPNAIITELWTAMRGQDVCVVDETLQAGDSVQITLGALSGLEAVVTRVMPAKQRVAVLLDFLGRQTTLELDRNQLSIAGDQQIQPRRSPVFRAAVPA